MALKAVYEGRGSVGTVPRQLMLEPFFFACLGRATLGYTSFTLVHIQMMEALHFRWVALRIAGNALTVVVTYLNLGGFAKLAG